MINQLTLELNAATDPVYRSNKDGDGEYATLLGIQNLYIGGDKYAKIPMNVLLQSNCVSFAKSSELHKGRRFLASGRLTYNDQHKSFTLKADQLSIFPAGPLKGASEKTDSPAEPASTAKPTRKK